MAIDDGPILQTIGWAGLDSYLGGGQRIAAMHQGLQSIFDRTADSSERMNAAGNALLAGGTAGAGGLLLWGKASLTAAGGIEASTRTLEALTHSAGRANTIMGQLDTQALDSAFSRKDITASGTLLTAYGLDIQKFLPLSDDLAAAFISQGARIEDTARVFGRLKSGDFGEAFERLRDFGIARKDLEGEGLKFDNSGHYTGSVEAALSAVENIVRSRFGGLSKKLAQETLLGATSNLGDAWERLLATSGKTLIPIATDGIRAATGLITRVDAFLKEHPNVAKYGLLGGAALSATAIAGGGLLKLLATARQAGVLGGGLGGGLTATMNVQAGVVNVMGGGLGGALPGAAGGLGGAGAVAGEAGAGGGAALAGLAPAAAAATIAAGAYSAYKLPGLMRDAQHLSDEDMAKKGPWERGIANAGEKLGTSKVGLWAEGQLGNVQVGDEAGETSMALSRGRAQTRAAQAAARAQATAGRDEWINAQEAKIRVEEARRQRDGSDIVTIRVPRRPADASEMHRRTNAVRPAPSYG